VRQSTYGTVDAKERALSYEYITPNRALSLILHSLEHLHLVVRVCVCQHVRACHTSTQASKQARTRTAVIVWEIFVFVRVICLFCERYLDGGQDKERERYKCGWERRKYNKEPDLLENRLGMVQPSMPVSKPPRTSTTACDVD